jgi:hypothetical protein
VVECLDEHEPPFNLAQGREPVERRARATNNGWVSDPVTSLHAHPRPDWLLSARLCFVGDEAVRWSQEQTGLPAFPESKSEHHSRPSKTGCIS